MKRILIGLVWTAMLSPAYAVTDPGAPGPGANLDDNEPPVVAVKDFYRQYLSGTGVLPAKLARYLDPSLIRSLNQWGECESGKSNARCSTECVKFSCKYGEVWIDQYDNYFTKTGRWWPSWSTSIRPTITYYGDTFAELKVLIGKDPDPFIHLKVVMQENKGQWRIVSVDELR